MDGDDYTYNIPKTQAPAFLPTREQWEDAQATIAGITHVLKLDAGRGLVNQCEHLRDELDELRAALSVSDSLRAELQKANVENAALKALIDQSQSEIAANVWFLPTQYSARAVLLDVAQRMRAALEPASAPQNGKTQ